MSGHGFLLARAPRRTSLLVTVLLAVAMLPVLVLAGPAQAIAGSDPGGNNGTVKIVGHGDFDAMPQNDPHVGCTFDVEWYGFDKGADIISKVTFEMQAPTASVGLSVDGPPEVFVGGDSATGAGTATGLDGRKTYTLTFDGPPHLNQGYHVLLTIHTPGSIGNDKKSKVFWVEGCAPYVPPAPGISLEKSVVDSADADTTGDLGEALTYSFAVTNTGNVPLTGVTITDPKLGMTDVACVASLAVGETKACPVRKYTVTAADIAAGQVHNTAIASGKPPTGPNVTDPDDATIATPPKPGLVLDKTVTDSADADSVASLGEVLTYTFTVTNIGNVPLTNVRIDDVKLSMADVVCAPTLAVGTSATCTRTYTVTAADVAAGQVLNLATAKGNPPSGPPVSHDDDAKVPTHKPTPAIALSKLVTDSADADKVGSLGEQLTYTLVVTNTGTAPLTNVRVSDPKLGMTGVVCAPSLAVGASATCPVKQYTVTQADVLAGKVVNIATATGTPPSGPDVTDPDEATISTPSVPGLALQKSVADSADAGNIADLGETLTYTFKVTNTGNVPLTNVVIDDPILGLADVPCVAVLGVGATVTCPAQSYQVTAADVAAGTIHNVATATGTPPSGDDQVATDDATICTEVALPRIFLDKQVVEPSGDGKAAEGEVLTYTFAVTNTGNVKLTGVTVTDPMLGLVDAPCVASLAPGETSSCPLLAPQSHTVTAADVASGWILNTATAGGTPPSGPPVEDDDDAKVPTKDPTPADAGISIVKTADVSLAGPGDTVTYTLDVSNSGPGDADDVTVTDTLPAGTTYLSSTAPCTYSHPTVTCQLGTVDAGDDRAVTIKVKVHPVGAGGSTSHQHQLDYTKVEAHVSLFDDQSGTVTASCPSGYVATDGSVRIDHVDAGTGTFEDVVVLASGVTSDGRAWSGTVRNDATGQVQAKVNVVCATERTSSGEDHHHPLVITGPVVAPRTLAPGRHEVDLACDPGSQPVRPSFAFSSGEGRVTTLRTPAGWRFVVAVDAPAVGSFGIGCLAPSLGAASGHTHDLRFGELSDSVTVPAGQVVETRLTCSGDQKGIVAWADLDPGLVPLGNDPQPVTRVFRFHNPTGGALTARFGLLCVDIRTNGGGPKDTVITNTASVTTSSHDASPADNSSSASVTVSPTGVSVSPRASVQDGRGATSVRLRVATGAERAVTFTLVASGKVKGTSLRAGSVLAKGKARLEAGNDSVRLVASRAAAKALATGKIRTARIVLTARGGHRDVRAVSLRA